MFHHLDGGRLAFIDINVPIGKLCRIKVWNLAYNHIGANIVKLTRGARNAAASTCNSSEKEVEVERQPIHKVNTIPDEYKYSHEICGHH